MKQRDCAGCGAPVGLIDRAYCCLCTRRVREAAAKSSCPGCGKQRVLVAATGRCVLCSRRCTSCGGPVRARDATLCRPCLRRAEREAAKSPCPRCGKPGLLREHTGWCGSCSRPGPPKQPPRICAVCGQLRRHAAHGMCERCWQRHPDRPFVRGQHLAAGLEEPPPWLAEFVGHLAGRHCAAVACTLISALGRLLADEHPNHPQALLERARRPGRSMGSLARALEDFFTARRLALPTDQGERLAAGRRQRILDAVPVQLRPAVAAYAEWMLAARVRARRAGTRPRADHTIETALRTMRDLARFLVSDRDKHDWAVVDVTDVEAFLAALPAARKRRLTVLRQFFRLARNQRRVLVDPSHGLTGPRYHGFTGATLPLDRQRELFARWSGDSDAHPHEALLGILALLHGAASREVRLLRVGDVDLQAQTLRLGRRPHPVPLDPVSLAVLHRCLAHRETLGTDNPYVVVTRGTKAGRQPASTAYFTQLLDPAGINARMLRGTRLIDLVNSMDPKLVGAAFGLDPQGVLIYLADRVDDIRWPEVATNT